MRSKLIFTFLLLLCSTTLLYSLGNLEEPEGNVFTIELKKTEGKRSGWQWTWDELSFESGKLITHEMRQKEQFKPARVIVKKEDDGTIHFSAHAINSGASSLEWKGTIRESQIEGTVEWHNMQGVQVYKFSGKLKE